MKAEFMEFMEKQFGIFISYEGKGKILDMIFFQNFIDRPNFKFSLLGSGFHWKMKIHVSKDCRDIKLEKLT